MNLTMFAKLILTASCLAIVAGCSGSGGAAGTTDSGSGSVPLEIIKSTSPLYITITSQYDGPTAPAGPVSYHGVCNIDPDNLAANDITCTITIPEGKLFFSPLTFTYGTGNKSLCPRIEFYPYYRRVSNAAAYVPPGGSEELDCSDPTTDLAGCYDGVAADIVPGFPAANGLWQTTDTVSEFSATAKSSWKFGTTYGNTHTCNNLSAAGRMADISIGGGGPQIYESFSNSLPAFQDYEIACLDQWQGTLFRIVMTIADEDTDASDTAPGDDEFYDWQ